MADKAGRWLRVSTGGQDEASQVPDVDNWCESHEYETDPSTVYVVHGKSAYHGEQAKALDKALADMRAGRINVLVAWAYDRVERRSAGYAFDLARKVKDAGGRVEFVKDSHLNVANEMSDVMLALAATIAHQESKRKSERIVIKHNGLRQAGSVIGRAPYGFRIVKQGEIKTLVPVPAEASVVQDAAQWYLDGMTLDDACAKLNVDGRLPRRMRNGKQPEWCPKTLSGILRNEAVAGRRRNGEGWTVKPEAILTRSTYDAVVRRMDARATRKGISQTATPALLTSVIKCGKCQRNMYRTGTGYYCRVKGCKSFILLTIADRWVDARMVSLDCRDMVEVVIPGGNHDDAINELKRDMQDAVTAEDFGRLTELKVELDRLRSLPAKPATVERRESDKTVAEMWQGLANDGERRAFLLERQAVVTYEVNADGKSRLYFTGPWLALS